MDNKCLVKGLSHLFIVYLVWGSTYLAMRVCVMSGAGFEPFALGWTRMFCASSILFFIAWVTNRLGIPDKKDLIRLIITGNILWVCGHGLVLWSEKYIASSYAALCVGSTPIWTMILESLMNKTFPKMRAILFVFIGFIGLIVLVFPNLANAGFSGNYFSIITIFAGTIFWSIGFVVQKKMDIKLPSITTSAYQQFFAAIGFLIVSVSLGEKVPRPSSGNEWLAWSFLVIFGSVIAFTSFIKALKLLPNSIVVTYAYVNPIIAMILGYTFLNEKITIYTLIGAVLVVLSVVGVMINPKLKKEVACNY